MPKIGLVMKLLLFLLLIPMAFAHLDAEIFNEVNGISVEIGYAPDPLTTKESSIFSVSFENVSTNESITPDSVWLRIADEKKIYFGGYLDPSDPAITFQFPNAGKYDVTIKTKNPDLESVAYVEVEGFNWYLLWISLILSSIILWRLVK